MSSIPDHIAIIMDGNGRWARRRHMPRVAGHRRGADRARDTVRHYAEAGVRYLTLFAFSSENWRRPEEEVSFLMELFASKLLQETDSLNENSIRLRVIGDTSGLPGNLQQEIERSERATANNDRMTLMVAANYGGRWDITQAARRLAERVAEGELASDDIDEELFGAELISAGVPDPDLLIRTGGERRVSNFLLWQLAYCEFYFCDCLWPEFGREERQSALDWYASRERRYGRTSEQLGLPDSAAG
ncbi:MAG: polyprenyl diphosphate synthase [Pseudomonadota bacterium]|nr:polyprenyl diphosphate synthase [Pseudomonadota bacterium]